MIKIGVITAKNSNESITRAHDAIKNKCAPSYLVYSSMQEVAELYEANKHTVDGFLFSGRLPYDYIATNIEEPAKPCGWCGISSGDIYKLFLSLAPRYPDLDFSRVLIHEPHVGEYLSEVLPPAKMPMTALPNTILGYAKPGMYETFFNAYKEAYEQHDIDLIVTRLANVSARLSEVGINSMTLHPSSQSVIDATDDLLLRIQSSIIEDMLTVFCIFDCSNLPGGERDIERVHEYLNHFNALQNLSFIVRRDGPCFELTTSHLEMRRRADNYNKIFDMHSYVKERLGTAVPCAAGVGDDIVTARQKALRALREVKHHPDQIPIIISRSNNVILSVENENTAIFSFNISDEIQEMASRLEMSPFNLQRIFSLIERKGSNHLTSAELAGYLGIQQRSAARILSKLGSGGAAKLVRSQQMGLSGRPAKVYEILIDKLGYRKS